MRRMQLVYGQLTLCHYPGRLKRSATEIHMHTPSTDDRRSDDGDADDDEKSQRLTDQCLSPQLTLV